MDAEQLTTISQEAIAHMLRWHEGPDAKLDETDKMAIEEGVGRVMPLRERAEDQDVANMEIVCDSAMYFVDAYNQQHPDAISPYWLYKNIQALVCIKFKPVLGEGPVSRLLSIDIDDAQPDDESLEQATPPSSPELADRYDTVDPEVSSVSNSEAVRMKVKMHWRDDEIGGMIRLKIVDGLANKQIAPRIGRTSASVAAKWSNEMKKEKWQKFAEECRNKRRWTAYDGPDDEDADEDSERLPLSKKRKLDE